jgi:multidrug efflux system outer membrane protein
MRTVFYTLSILLLSACTLYKAPDVPDVDAPQHFKSSIKVVNENLDNEWWKNFNSEQLNELVALGLKNNYNYKIAIKNIQIAQTYVSQNMSYLFPQVNANFGSSRNKLVESEFFGAFGNTNNSGGVASINAPEAGAATGIESAPFNVAILSASATYEVDVWNEIRNSVNQAEANQAASVANSDVVKLTLISSIVNTYYQIVALNANHDNLHKQYAAAKEIVELAQVQFKSGLVDASTVYSTQNQQEAILSNIKTLEKQQQILEYTLAYLLSEYPENFSIKPSASLNQLQFTQLIPPGIPAQMLAARPDIQAAYSQMMSYGYLEKQTIANFLPSFTLTSNYGYANSTLGQLLEHSNAFWSYGLGVSQYVFDYAIRMSEYKRAEYQFESAILTYKDTVVNAFTEVNSALVSYEDDKEALSAIEQQYKNSYNLLSLADAQYQGGLIDYSSYLSNDLNYLQSEYNLTSQQLLVVQDIIQVYKTLGLGLAGQHSD